ncbi:MAG: sodium:alanine symporter family protein [Proteocatella sp.]
MEAFLGLVSAISNWLWGIPLLVLLGGGGLFLTIYLGFFQFKYLPFIVKETFGKMFSKPEGEGTVSPFQAATAALASTVGASNIVGVPVAIAFGGPGAIFWMWVFALIGSASKFSEILLGIKYREKNEEGEFVGGPMYYLAKGLKSKFLGAFFAFFLMIEIVPSIATQSVSFIQTAGTIGIPKMVSAIFMTVIVLTVVYGGIKRITKVTEKMVPLMALLYLAGALVIIAVNITELPRVIALIFTSAFTPLSAAGGFAGSTIAGALRWGSARGTYSNEAGMGTAPMAHCAAVTDHPARQACWGIFEIIVDTMLICTTTAFVVLTTGLWETVPASEAASIPALAFQSVFGKALGGGMVTFFIMMFVLSTIIVLVFYGEKQAEFLFGIKVAKVMKLVNVAAIIFGAIGGIEFLYQFLDLLLALVIIPNMIGLIVLRKEIKASIDEFFGNPKYNPGAKKQLEKKAQ